MSPSTVAARRYPGARRPEREYRVDANGLAIATYEWGDLNARPVFLAHGNFDFAATFDLLAPILADAGYRVIAWDQRGHGDSEHAALYTSEADVRDAMAVIESVTDRAAAVVGHSKGGVLMMQLAEASPHRVSHLVNLDGLPGARTRADMPEHERMRMLSQNLSRWLDFRREAADKSRRPGTLEEVAERRARMNPRLDIHFLRYLVTIGARQDDDGWRWKFDPTLHMGGVGPYNSEIGLARMRGFAGPFLGVMGSEIEQMSWDTLPEDVRPFLPRGGQLEVLEETGHFVHIERPQRVAALITGFLANHEYAKVPT